MTMVAVGSLIPACAGTYCPLTIASSPARVATSVNDTVA